MDSLFGLDWGEMFGLSMSPAELVVRGTAVYWFLFLIFRFVIRREVGAVGIADILVLVIVADASQNAMAGEYTSVTDGLILVSTLIWWNFLFDWLNFRFPAFRRFAEPQPLPLIERGRLNRRNMRKEFITDDELWAKLRAQGIESLQEVKKAYLETDGEITVIKQKK